MESHEILVTKKEELSEVKIFGMSLKETEENLKLKLRSPEGSLIDKVLVDAFENQVKIRQILQILFDKLESFLEKH